MNDTRSHSRRRLRRSDKDRVLTGVSGGLGRYLGIDPVIVRIGFVVLALAGGSGVPLYVAAWLLMPDADGRPGLGRRILEHRGIWWIVAICLAVSVGLPLLFATLALMFGIGGSSFGGGLVVPIILVCALIATAAGRDERPRHTTPDPGGDGPDDVTGEVDEDDEDEVVPQDELDVRADPSAGGRAGGDDLPPATAGDEPGWPHRRPRRRPGPSITRMTLGLLLVASGAVWIAVDREAVVDPSATALTAGALGIVGLGLVIGSRFGRARGLIPVGIVLTAVLSVTSVVDSATWRGGVGERTYVPRSVAEVADRYRLLAGEMRLDLTAVSFADGSTTHIELSQGAGELTILVPADLLVTVDAHVGAGELRLADEPILNGISLDRTTSFGPTTGAALELDIDVGAGSVRLFRGGAVPVATATDTHTRELR